jgi:NADH-quinone oxidoreductase subunit F
MTRTILVCCGTGCIANGSLKTAGALRAEIAKTGAAATVETRVKQTGCHGLCEQSPLVTIMPDDIAYYKVRPEDAADIIASIGQEPVERLLFKKDDGKRAQSRHEHPFYARQMKIVLRNVGIIDPDDINDYMAHGGYEALKKALAMTADAIISEVEKSGLRGRGGAGFPTGRKWRIAAGYDSFPKYVIMNGDEGDPGAFMDCSLLEGDPHSVIEGLIISALAIGAEKGFLYIRDEYGPALLHTQKALDDAEKAGILGASIMGSGKSLSLEIVRGGGAFVCGESTALVSSIEGKPGEPRAKYIRTVEKGLFGQPTVLNNVETLANVPIIIRNGGEKFAAIGTPKSPGTKVFALVGKVKRTGLVEVPMGITLRELIYGIGGGIIRDRPFKCVQTGGPSGGCIPAGLLDTAVDFDSLIEHGSMMGSGGMIVTDDHTCIVDFARYYANFLTGESCGKCTPCREGLRQLTTILSDICEGTGRPDDLKLIEAICETMAEAALCGLGKSAPNPVMTTLKHFSEEYEEHIRDKRCRAGICRALSRFAISGEKCEGCGLCKKVCPVSAIEGTVKKTHAINQDLCVKCGECRNTCAFDAVSTTE